jgi:hypothetical protein
MLEFWINIVTDTIRFNIAYLTLTPKIIVGLVRPTNNGSELTFPDI